MNNLNQDINFVYFKKIDKIYNSFNDSINDLKELLFLIYEIYYKNDQFKVINNNIKETFKSTINLLFKNHNYYYQNIKFNFNNKQSYIDLIITLYNYNFNLQFLEYLINILNVLNPNIINKYDLTIYDKKYIINWFQEQKIDLNQEIINIKGILIPNFIKLNKKFNLIDLDFEFYHLLFKIYKPVIERNFCFYEAGYYNISEKDVIFDCGANMGLFAAYAANKGAQVYCFEPMSYIRNYLLEVQKLYPNNIKIIPCAIGIKEEFQSFQQRINPGESKISQNLNLIKGDLYKEQVHIINLDNFIEENQIFPTFIKMDIEGSELYALNGCKNFLQDNKIILSLSLDHSQEDKFLIPNFIQQLNLNYNIYYYTKGENINNSLFILCK